MENQDSEEMNVEATPTDSKVDYSYQKTINSGAKTELSNTPFRQAEKFYKLKQFDRRDSKRKKAEVDDFTDVVDLHNLEANTEANKKMICPVGKGFYTFSAVPDLYFLPGAISVEEQKKWCTTIITTYASPPYKNNITKLGKEAPNGYIEGMRWATLGYNYDWNAKCYNPQDKSVFPSDLATLVSGFIKQLDEATNGAACTFATYKPETAIVNYFPVGTTMMAHQDISEECLDVPLVSMSFSCTSIFLMGTESRYDPPYAFFMKSGDVAFFTGKCRAAFHAVPRILDDCPAHLQNISKDFTLDSMRLNINVRQVYPPAKKEEKQAKKEEDVEK